MDLLSVEDYCRNIYHSRLGWENEYGAIKRNVCVAIDQDFLCALCGREFVFVNSASARNPVFYTHDMRQSSVDHIVPLGRGGINAKENLQLACQICNIIKGNSQKNFIELIEFKLNKIIKELDVHADYLILAPHHVRPRLIKLIKKFEFLLPEAEQLNIDISQAIKVVTYCRKYLGE